MEKTLREEIYTPMLELSEMSENGNTLIPMINLSLHQKKVVLAIILASFKEEGDIPFGDFDECTLRVVQDVKGTLISVIAPKDVFGRSYLGNDLVYSTQEF